MADYTDNARLACIKALDHVVRPAVDSSNPLALEQLHLVTGFLKFFRSRLPYWQARQLFELRHYRATAERLADDASTVSAAVSSCLEQAIAQARSLEQQDGAPQSEIKACVSALSGAISALARAAPSADPAMRIVATDVRGETHEIQGSAIAVHPWYHYNPSDAAFQSLMEWRSGASQRRAQGQSRAR